MNKKGVPTPQPGPPFPVIPTIPPTVTSGMIITASQMNSISQCCSDLWTDLQALNLAANPVTSVFTRTGAISAQAGDYASFYPPVTRRVNAGTGLGGGGALSADVTLTANVVSVYGRSGAIAAQSGDYAAFYPPLSRQILPGLGMSGGGDLNADRTLTADVQKVFGRTGQVGAQAGDYATFYPSLSGSYADPAWITSLSWSKVASATPPPPSFLVDPLTTAGDLVARTSSATTRLPLGLPGQVLTVDNAQPTGIKWAAPTGGMTDPTINEGDLIVRATLTSSELDASERLASAITRLPIGTNGQVLTVDTTQLEKMKWAPPGAASQTPWASDIDGATHTLFNVGKIGVGTGSPGKLVEIKQTVSASAGVDGSLQLFLTNAATDGSTATPCLVGIGFGRPGVTRQAITGGTYGYDNLDFYTAAAFTTPAMRIDANQRVGIGTKTPQSTFVVSNGGACGFEVTPGANVFGLTDVVYATSYNRSAAAYRDLAFDCGNNAAFGIYFKAGGNVCIGTPSSAAKLAVDGSTISTTAPATIYLANLSFTSGNQDNLLFTANRFTSGGAWNTCATRIQKQVDATNMSYVEFNPQGGNGGSLAFGYGNSEYMRVSQGGNIGIGTVGPAGRLQITASCAASADTGYIYLQNTAGVDASRCLIQAIGYNGQPQAYLGFIVNSASNWSSQLSFGVSNNTTSIEAMRINAGGFVGIANTNPQTPLDVTGAITTRGSGASVQVLDRSTNNNWTVYAQSDVFRIWNTAGAGDRFVVAWGGNCGIKTTNTGTASLVVADGSRAYTDAQTGVGGFSLSGQTGATTDDQLLMGVNVGNYAWIQAVKAGTAGRLLVLNAAGGPVSVSAPSAWPGDSTLVNVNQISFYLDETNNRLYFKVKYSTGVVKQGLIGVS